MILNYACFSATNWCLKGQSISILLRYAALFKSFSYDASKKQLRFPILMCWLWFLAPGFEVLIQIMKLMCLAISSSCSIWDSHGSGCEELCVVRYNVVYYDENKPMFQRNMSPPFSGSKNKPSKKALELDTRFIVFSLTVKTEVVFLRNAGWLPTDYTALYPIR
jgi:hypothetical protein